jgi:hypothetical protein
MTLDLEEGMLAKALDRISVRTIHITPDGMFAGDMLRVDRASFPGSLGRKALILTLGSPRNLLSLEEPPAVTC